MANNVLDVPTKGREDEKWNRFRGWKATEVLDVIVQLLLCRDFLQFKENV